MNRTVKTFSVTAALLCFAAIGCTDPTVAPKSTVTSANIFNDPNSYRAFLAKIYGGLIVTGQRGPDGNPDIAGIDEGFGEYLRLYWYLQEMPTDEAVIGWNDPGLPDLNTGLWGADNSMVNAMYYRVFYQVMLVNEFLRQSTDAKLDSRGQFDPTLGATPPKQATRADIYAYAVSELNDIIGQLPPRGPSTYGRATPEAAHMLLAKLYLNAGVYTGTPNFTGAVTEAQAVINAGYSLPTSFRSNFTADNNVSPELIFVAAQDGRSTQTWGGMTFLIHAGCGGSMSAASFGIDYCWGGYRMKQQTYRRFAAGDTRAAFFYTTGQTDSVSDRGDFTKGIAAPRFTNLKANGDTAQAKGMVDTDFPIFRLADAYLIYAEANIRGGGGSAANALTYLNAVRQRAYGNTTANFAALPPVDTILAERGRELMFEAQRRSDLVRFGVFTGAAYLWAWKGGTPGGSALPTFRDLYPLPANELIANPNLHQNPGY